jgi:vacuolar-type H+-ATPase subunit E/Vma4
MESEVYRIIDQIHQNARKNAKSILTEAHKSTEMMMEKQKKRAHQETKEEVSSILTRGEDEAEALRRTIITDAKTRASWMMLSEKEHLVTSMLDKAKIQLRGFSRSEKYVPFLQKLIVDAGVVLAVDMLEVSLSEQDATLPLKLSLLKKKIMEKTGKETKLEISNERIEAVGGCVIRTYNGRIVIDNTFPALLKRRERSLRFEIAKILFH